MSSKSSRPRQSATPASTRTPTKPAAGAKPAGAAPTSKPASTAKSNGTTDAKSGASTTSARLPRTGASATLPKTGTSATPAKSAVTAPAKPTVTAPARPGGATKAAGGSKARTGQTLSARQGRLQRKRRQQAWKQRIPLFSVIGVVVAFVLIVVIISRLNAGSNQSSFGPVPASVMSDLTGVSPTTFSTIGTGGISSNPLIAVSNTPILKDSSGKPIIVYYGGEYCPYCAAERWAIVVAFSRFGTFSSLHLMESSSSDQFPSTNTLTFYQSTYTSQYVDFQTVELYNRSQGTLQQPTTLQSQLLNTYNTSQYISSGGGGLPFIDFANQYLLTGASYDPGLLTGLSWQQIAQQISDPNSAIAKSVIGTANYLTAAICKATGDKPASVCQTSVIQNILK